MQKQWVFKYKTDASPCGYGYKIQLVNSNSVLNETSVNIDCEYMSGWIYFPKNYLTDYKNSFVRMSKNQRKDFIKTFNN